ncbi:MULTISPECIES: carboxylate--amine ligase/circularly permuted type 2 ATP-grasp protein [Catenuloplanes]|uniref:Putative glutamate--cysteine ligase 2 n=1 Tax=Catenuloplanes niger TaxID=587534 RepID=A0AAE3ZN27_9ACTN|nr:carboxylate--amine ligase/circularly permuted type 2 ATP-grasp protein [Catenuloplanes niger]MDR7321650.1 carboxylate-amine ligase [Catenuloplanes niger]
MVDTPQDATTLAPPDPKPGSHALTLGVEEEFHVIDLDTRELVPRAGELLERLPSDSFTAELQRSVVETNTAVTHTLDDLREEIVRLRRLAVGVADASGLGIAAAGTVPLLNGDDLEITPTARFRHMLDEYQMLAREQLICGAQVHVGIDDRDLAVAVAQRVQPVLPSLLALSASSPYWMGQDSGYASVRSLVWQRWPTAGDPGQVNSAADHDALVRELIATETISDPAMIYFDVRPSAHVPTVELRITDASSDVETVVLLAGLFRAVVRQEIDRVRAGTPYTPARPPVLRAALWRAARSGLEGDLIDLPRGPKPVPAAEALRRLTSGLRPYLEEAGDWDQVTDLLERALRQSSAAARQRRAFTRRGRLADVVDLILAETRGGEQVREASAPAGRLADYASAADEMFPDTGPPAAYREIVGALDRLGAQELRQREQLRDEEQRARGVTFSVAGEASTRLFPFDLVPRLVAADEWTTLRAGLTQRARALDAFLRDVYDERWAVKDGIIPAWVVDGSPGLKPTGALMRRQSTRVQVAGMDLVKDRQTGWHVLEDNLRVPSGIGYAIQNRRLTLSVLPELPLPDNLLPVDDTPAMLRRALVAAAPPAAGNDPSIVVLSRGPEDSAWFEHRLLALEMGVPAAVSTDLQVEDGRVILVQQGRRQRVDVIYLRMDEDELLHAPGADGMPLGWPILSAVHTGRVAVANALGNGVGDDKAIYAYVPKFIEYYLSEKPLLADVPTYLGGVPEQCEEILRRLGELVVKPVDGYGGDRVVIGPYASDSELTALRRQVTAAPHRWIAQEVVSLSTHPVFDGHRLAPRHVDLRAFVFLGEGAEVGSAALTRVAPEDSLIVNSSRGGGAKDTWLLG